MEVVRYQIPKTEELFLIYVGAISADLNKDIETYNHNPLIISARSFLRYRIEFFEC